MHSSGNDSTCTWNPDTTTIDAFEIPARYRYSYCCRSFRVASIFEHEAWPARNSHTIYLPRYTSTCIMHQALQSRSVHLHVPCRTDKDFGTFAQHISPTFLVHFMLWLLARCALSSISGVCGVGGSRASSCLLLNTNIPRLIRRGFQNSKRRSTRVTRSTHHSLRSWGLCLAIARILYLQPKGADASLSLPRLIRCCRRKPRRPKKQSDGYNKGQLCQLFFFSSGIQVVPHLSSVC